MGASGTSALNFGVSGDTNTSVNITGLMSILSNSLVEAWVFPTSTVNHSVDEHLVESFKVVAGNVVPGVGFTIYGITQCPAKIYGTWNVAWVWN